MAGLSIKLYENEMRQLATLPVEQSGKILYALLCNELAYELPELDIAETVIFNLIKGQTERARELSEKRSQVRKSSGQTADKNGSNTERLCLKLDRRFTEEFISTLEEYAVESKT